MRPAQPPQAALPSAIDSPAIPGHLLRNYSLAPETGCFLWNGYRDRKGYGRVHYQGRSYTAHRAAYLRQGDDIPVGFVLDHLCKNTGCVNPRHLEPVPQQINVARGVGPTAERTRARLAGTCINGHRIIDVGVHKQGRGWTCAQCGRERVRRYKSRKRAQAMGVSA